MDFVKQFTSPGGKASPTKAATTGEGGAAPPANTPTAATVTTVSASAPVVSGGGGANVTGDGDETPTTLGVSNIQCSLLPLSARITPRHIPFFLCFLRSGLSVL